MRKDLFFIMPLGIISLLSLFSVYEQVDHSNTSHGEVEISKEADLIAGDSVLRFGNRSDWHFVNGEWEDGEDAQLNVPKHLRRRDGDKIQGHHYAFNKDLSYKDVRVRFEFRLNSHSDAGIILRARDESNFYLLHFPNCGQASRAQHFWAAFSKMDESGYLKRIKMEMIRRVPSNNGLWLSADLTLKGSKIAVNIGEHGYFEAEDHTYYKAGQIGVYSFGNADIRNVTIEGKRTVSAPWNDTIQQPTNWFYPCPDTVYGLWQRPQDLMRLPDGTLLLSYAVQEKPYEGKITPLLTRSSDNGHTWSKPEPLQFISGDDEWLPPRLHVTPGGRLINLVKTDMGYLTAESKDGGHTWSEAVPAGIGPPPKYIKSLHLGPQVFLNLADDSMVLFCYAGHDLKFKDLTIYTWGSVHCQAFACRSTDDGRTWSAPVNVDNPGIDKEGKLYDGNLDLTEVCGAQMSDGRIMALIRPIYSPWMWETWSTDGGATWGPIVRGPFPGYGSSNMLRTASGALLVAHRLPSMTINCSFDDGHTWDEGTLVDSAIWIMGSMIEVEPDVVLYVYWDSFESLMRAQYFRVTSTGLEPIRAQ